MVKNFRKTKASFSKYWLIIAIAFLFAIKIFVLNNLFLPVEYHFIGPEPNSFYLVETSIQSNEQKQFFRTQKLAGDTLYRQLCVLVPVSYVTNNPDAKIVLKVGQKAKECLLKKFNKKAFQTKDGDYIKVNFPSKNLLLDSRGYDLFTNISLFNLFISILCNVLLIVLLLFLVFRKIITAFIVGIDKRILWLAGISFLLRLPWVFLLRFTDQWLYFFYDIEILTQIRTFPEGLFVPLSSYGMSTPLLLAPMIKAISYLFVWSSPLLRNIDIWMSAAVLTGFVSAVFGAGTIIMVYLLAKRLWGERAGFIAALLLFIDFSHLIWSATAVPDITSGFFLLLNFHYYFLIMNKRSVLDFFKLAILTAFLMGMKLYNGLFLIIPILGMGVQCFQRKGVERKKFCKDTLGKLIVYVFFSLLFLLLLNPYIVISDYIAKLASPMYMDGVVLDNWYSWKTFLYQFRNILAWFNKPLLLITVLGLWFSAFRPSFEKFLVFFFLAANFLIFRERMWGYYLSAWAPLVYVLTAPGISFVLDRIHRVLSISRFLKLALSILILVVVLLFYYFNVIKMIPSSNYLDYLADGETIGLPFTINDDKKLNSGVLLFMPALKGTAAVVSIFDYPDYILLDEDMKKRAYLFSKSSFLPSTRAVSEKSDINKRFDFIVTELENKYYLVKEFSFNRMFYEVADTYYVYKKK